MAAQGGMHSHKEHRRSHFRTHPTSSPILLARFGSFQASPEDPAVRSSFVLRCEPHVLDTLRKRRPPGHVPEVAEILGALCCCILKMIV
ncbi:hypothetical protein C0J45_1822 [Silurus meridionalis]|nr:hypothetical protein C0J45_1822 [Silurus meridionalis]